MLCPVITEVRVLVDALAGLLERSEASFEGFEDFHQIATALNGLQGTGCYPSFDLLFLPYRHTIPTPYYRRPTSAPY